MHGETGLRAMVPDRTYIGGGLFLQATADPDEAQSVDHAGLGRIVGDSNVTANIFGYNIDGGDIAGIARMAR